MTWVLLLQNWFPQRRWNDYSPPPQQTTSLYWQLSSPWRVMFQFWSIVFTFDDVPSLQITQVLLWCFSTFVLKWVVRFPLVWSRRCQLGMAAAWPQPRKSICFTVQFWQQQSSPFYSACIKWRNPSVLVSRWLSVRRMNFLPYRYCWNVFTPKTMPWASICA